jgi:hypothetical protein
MVYVVRKGSICSVDSSLSDLQSTIVNLGNNTRGSNKETLRWEKEEGECLES